MKKTTFIDTKKAALRDLDDLLTEAGAWCAVDTEFDTNARMDRDLVIWSRSRRKGERVVILAEFAVSVYKEWLEDPTFKKVWSDFRADAPVFGKLSINMGPSFGADIVHEDFYLDENEKKHGLKPQVARHLRRRRKDYTQQFCYVPQGKKKAVVLMPGEIMGSKPFPPDALKVRSQEEWVRLLIDYSGDDAEDTIILHEMHKKHLKSIGYWKSGYLKIDAPLSITLQAVQPRGMLLDQAHMRKVRALAKVDQLRAERVFRTLTDAPADLNLNAKGQVRQLLVDQLGWPTYDDLRTGKTDEAQMTKEAFRRWEKEGYEAAKFYRKREVCRKLSSDVTGLLEGVSPDSRIRSETKQLGATTTRMTSKKWREVVPVVKTSKKGVTKTTYKKKLVGANLYNIVSKSEKDPYGVRRGFTAPKAGQVTADGVEAKEDHSLIIADEAGFELVIASHWAAGFVPDARAAQLIKQYGTASVLHVDTAIEIFKLPITVVEWMSEPSKWKAKYKREYDIAKILNFSLLYGGNEWTLTQKREMDTQNKDHLEENRLFLTQWFDAKPEFGVYGRKMVRHGYDFGWVPTIAGARQHVGEGLASRDRKEISHWENKCKNGPVQVSAGQILTMAMNAIERDLELKHDGGYRMTVQVYDEIVGECPTRHAEENRKRVHWHMEQPFKDVLRVPLTVESKVAQNWGEK